MKAYTAEQLDQESRQVFNDDRQKAMLSFGIINMSPASSPAQREAAERIVSAFENYTLPSLDDLFVAINARPQQVFNIVHALIPNPNLQNYIES